MSFKSVFYLIAVALLLNGCGLGREEPLWQSGTFSTDGKYYAYTYSVTTISGIKSRGGATSRQGFIRNYLQVINLTTGKKLLEEPYKSKGMLWLQHVEGNYIWLKNLDISKGVFTPSLFDLAAQTMRFDAKSLQKLNPEVFAKSTSTFYTDKATGAVCVEAADGRKYRIDPVTGKANLTTGNFERIEDKSAYSYQTENSIEGFTMSGDTRQKIIKYNVPDHDISSKDDFINPKFLAIETAGLTGESKTTFYNNHFFVISDNSTTDKKDRQLTMLDKSTLQAPWSIALPQEPQEMNNYNKERFFLKGNQLFVSNSTHLLIIDVDKGTIVHTYPLFEKN